MKKLLSVVLCVLFAVSCTSGQKFPDKANAYLNINGLRTYTPEKIENFPNAGVSLVQISKTPQEVNSNAKVMQIEKQSRYFSPNSYNYEEFSQDEIVLQHDADWNYLPVEVTYSVYSCKSGDVISDEVYTDGENRPKQEWVDYFRNKINERLGENYNPIIINEAWTFTYNSKEYAVVNATNIADDLTPLNRMDTYSFYISRGEAAVYSMSAFFAPDSEPVDIMPPVIQMLNSKKEGERTLFMPRPATEENGEFVFKCFMYQEENVVEVYDIFASYDNISYRELLSQPSFLVADTDGDEKAELIVCKNDFSKSNRSVISYEINKGKLKRKYYMATGF